jgi:hypothetical protein
MQQMIQEIGAVIIAAMVFLMLMNVSSRNSETTATQVLNSAVQEGNADAADIINRDFRLIGYGVIDSVRIPWADTSLGIAFKADLEDSGSVDSIAYHYDGNNHLLTRSVNGSAPIPVAVGVKEFELMYYDANGDVTFSPSSIATIKVCLMVEGTAKFEDEEKYPAVYWERTIRPLNLR